VPTIRTGSKVTFIDGSREMSGVVLHANHPSVTVRIGGDCDDRVLDAKAVLAVDDVPTPPVIPTQLVLSTTEALCKFLLARQSASDSALPAYQRTVLLEIERRAWSALSRLLSAHSNIVRVAEFCREPWFHELVPRFATSALPPATDETTLSLCQETLKSMCLMQEAPVLPVVNDASPSPSGPADASIVSPEPAAIALKMIGLPHPSGALKIESNRICNSAPTKLSAKSSIPAASGQSYFEVEIVSLSSSSASSSDHRVWIGCVAECGSPQAEVLSFSLPSLAVGDRLGCMVTDSEVGSESGCHYFLNGKNEFGCDDRCSKSHDSDAVCIACGSQWRRHSGHDCPSSGSNAGKRGSFPSDSSVKSRKQFSSDSYPVPKLFAHVTVSSGVTVALHFAQADMAHFSSVLGKYPDMKPWRETFDCRASQHAVAYPFAAWFDLAADGADDCIGRRFRAEKQAPDRLRIAPIEAIMSDQFFPALQLSNWNSLDDGFTLHFCVSLKEAAASSAASPPIARVLVRCGSWRVEIDASSVLVLHGSHASIEIGPIRIQASSDQLVLTWTVCAQTGTHSFYSGDTLIGSSRIDDMSLFVQLGFPLEFDRASELSRVLLWRFALPALEVSALVHLGTAHIQVDAGVTCASGATASGSASPDSDSFLGAFAMFDESPSVEAEPATWAASANPVEAWQVGRVGKSGLGVNLVSASRSAPGLSIVTTSCAGAKTSSTGGTSSTDNSTFTCTAISRPVSAKADLVLKSGTWYYEVRLPEESTRIWMGWARPSWVAGDDDRVGDGHDSWSVDVQRRDRLFNGTRHDFGRSVSRHDTIGAVLCLEAGMSRSMHWIYNGEMYVFSVIFRSLTCTAVWTKLASAEFADFESPNLVS
jgi:hypothetical protein